MKIKLHQLEICYNPRPRAKDLRKALTFAHRRRFFSIWLDEDYDVIIMYSDRNRDQLPWVKVIHICRLLGGKCKENTDD